MSRRSALAASLLVFSIAVPSGVLAAPAPAAGEGPASPFIVVLADGAGGTGRGKAIDRVTARHGLGAERRFENLLGGFSANLNPGQARALAADPEVTAVVPDDPIELTAQSMPTGVARIGGRVSPVALIDGADTRVDADVAVVDTGIDPTQPDLNVVGGVNCTSSDRNAWQDENNHGTHVAGTIGAKDNDLGVVGVAPGVRLWAVRILDASGSGLLSWYICGLDWIAAQRDPADGSKPLIEAVNMSVAKWGTDDGACGSRNGDLLHGAICRLVDSGVTVVAAAGNDAGPAASRVPAAYDEVITVSALADTDGRPGGLGGDRCFSWGTYDVDDTFADFSNYGPDVDLIAPGKCIWSTKPGNTYGWSSGTSMAAPHVTGAAALYLASRPGATPAEVKRALLYLGSTNWLSSTDPDGIREPLLDVSRIGPIGTVAITPSQASVVVAESGGSVPVTLTLTRPGVLEDLALSVGGAPSGVSATLAAPSLFGFEATTTTMTVSVPPGSASGTWPLTVSAAWHGVRATATVQLVVESDRPVSTPPGFNIRAREVLGTSTVPVIVSWKAATDATSAIAAYELAERIDGGAWKTVASLAAPTTNARRSIVPGHAFTWRVRARDAVGNWGDWVEARSTPIRNIGERTSAVTYRGTWSTVWTSLAWGGTRRTTTALGATATFKVYGSSAALIGTLGPYRGSADIYVDGVKVVRVSEWNSTTRNRAIVAYLSLGSLGTHTVVVRNLATSGRARFDVDGLILVR